MKTAMKLTTGILATLMVCGPVSTKAVAQNTDAIDQARSIAKSLQQKQANDTNAALDAAGVKQSDPQAAPQTSPAAKPAPGAPAPAVKPAVIPGAQPGVKPAAKPAPVAQTATPVAASGQHNQLQKVNVVQNSDSIEIEISSSEAVTPRVSKLSSPARVVVELPETVVASAQNKIPVGSGGVKGVRIGMDGKTPPTTSVVVDLEKALAYDINGADGKLVLTLHTQGGEPEVAKSEAKSETKTVASGKPASAKVVAGKPATASQLKTVAASPAAKSTAVKTGAAQPKQSEKQSAAKETKAAAPAANAAET